MFLKQRKWTRKCIAWVMLIQFILQPALVAAEAVPDASADSQNKPTVATQNGVPVILITAPSAAGISRNIFTTFNIDSQGLIFNNSQTATITQLAGSISGNANLTGGMARIILTEVTGSSSSQLNGYLEVAGQRADVIIANPNGIVCSGLGFINTGRGVLTTGTPVFGGSGSLDAFRVTGGQVSIEGTGVAASDTDQFDIISRAANVNAEIWGKNLNVIAGANQVTYTDLSTQKITGDANKPALAIDVGALGGMYANKILLVGTEAGVGVNNQGTVSASSGDLILTSDGTVTNQGAINAEGNVSLTTAGAFVNSDGVTAGQNITISASGLSSTGIIGAGIDDGTLGTSGDLTINATSGVVLSGQQQAGGNVSITGASIDHTGGVTNANGSAAFTASSGDITNTGATLQAGSAVSLTASGTVVNETDSAGTIGQIIADKITITAANIDNQKGSIQQTGSDTTTLTATGTLNNTGGDISTNGTALEVSAGTFINSQGQLQQAGTGTLTVEVTGAIENASGSIATNGQANLTANSIDSTQGSISAQKDLNIHATTLTNTQGTLTSVGGMTISAQGALTNNTGVIQAGKGLEITAQSLNNQSGEITSLDASGATVTVSQEIKNESGLIGGNGSVTVTGQNLDNQYGQVQAVGDLTVAVTQKTDNTSGTIAASGALALHMSGDLVNASGTISAADSLTAAAGAVTNTSGTIEAAKDITFTAQSLSNSGTVAAGQDMTVTLSGGLTNSSGGKITANGDISVTSGGTVINAGEITAVKDVSLSASSITNAAGASIVAGDDVTISSSGFVNNGKVDGTKVTLNGVVTSSTSSAVLDDTSAPVAYTPILDTAANGVTLIQIASPSAAGVSRNLYTQFNVSSSGLILNNSTGYVQTELGGYIANNWRLGTTPAKIILNEVTSTSASKLNGFIEVAGQKADLVIANPNGIIVDGAGFINTSRVSLATGASNMGTNGSFDSLNVTGGSITVQGDGLDGSSTDQTDLISRVVTVNSGIWAKQLNVVAGANQVEYSTLDTTKITGNANSPTVSIDVGSLGGMYANAITLVGTEQGLGVTTSGTISASSGNLTVTNEGNITITGTTYASGDITITGQEDLTNQGTIYSQGNTNLYIKGAVKNKSGAAIYSASNITIAGSNAKDASGRSTTAAQSVLNQSATINAGGSLEINAQQITNEKREFVTGWNTTTKNYQFSITPLPGHYAAKRRYTEVIQVGTIKKDSNASMLESGGNMFLTGNLDNSYSTIVSGGDLTINSPVLNNLGYQNTTVTTDTGTDTHYWKIAHHRRWHIGCWDEYHSTVLPYYKQTTVNADGTSAGVINANGTLNITAGSINNRVVDAAGKNLTTSSQITPSTTLTSIDTLPTSSLYSKQTDPTAKYLVVTNSSITNYTSFLSSDYLLQRVTPDPTKTLKRLGDGCYEQELIRNQITELTGKRYLSGYSSDEEEYKALMENGVYYAKQFNLEVGVALTAEQMANLTSDMVWLVEKEVDGEKVLVPVVYLANTTVGDLKESGALIAASDINLIAGNDLSNQGVISATDRSQVSADNVTNSGTISAETVAVTAQTNIVNQNGTISGTDVALSAGGSVTNETTVSTTEYGTLTQSTTGQQAAITADGSLSVTAGGDVTISGATVEAGGALSVDAGGSLNVNAVTTETSVSGTSAHDSKIESQTTSNLVSTLKAGGSATLTAQEDITVSGATVLAGSDLTVRAEGDVSVSAVKDRDMQDVAVGDRNGDAFNRSENDDETVVGGSLSATGNVTVVAAGGDVTLAGSTITSENGSATVAAAQNVTVNAVTEKHESLTESRVVRQGVLYSKTNETKDYSLVNQVESSTISGNTVNVLSGNDITVTGSNVVSTSDVTLSADGNIAITSAEETSSEEHYSYEKKSGIFSGGGIGFTIGKQSEKNDSTTDAVTQVVSTIGSTEGNVTITANQDATITASDIIGSKDISITGENITVSSATNTVTTTDTYEYKQSGITVSVSNGTISAAEKAVSEVERSRAVADDRLEALYLYKAEQDAETVKKAVGKDGIKSVSQGLTVSVSVGSSSQKSETVTTETYAQGSTLTAGENLTLTATGSGTTDTTSTATDGDIHIVGSSVNGADIDLTAAKDVTLEAADNTVVSTTTSSSSSVGAGVEISKASKPSYFVQANKSGDNATETITTHTETTVIASDILTITSGSDTNLTGAQAKGETVNVTVGGDLNVASQQDTDNYTERSSSVGGKISTTGVTGSASKGNTDSTYASVTTQSGLYAGTGGFDITVTGNTDLKGAVIASDADADKNTLTTGTLTYSDIQNSAEYKASSTGYSLQTTTTQTVEKQGDKDTVVSKDSLTSGYTPGMTVSGNADSTTKSAISSGTIVVKSGNTDLSNLSRDTNNAVNALGKIFDKETVKEKQELTQLFGEVAYKLVGDLATSERKKALDDAAAAKKAENDATDEESKTKAESVYKEAMAKASSWEDGGVNKILLHSLVGGIMSDLGGNGFSSGAVGAGVNEAVQKELAKIKDAGVHELASALVGAAASAVVGGNAQAGAAAAASGTKNNWLTHDQQVKMANELKAALDAGDIVKANQIIAYYANKSQENRANEPYSINELEATESLANDGAGLQEQLQRFANMTGQTLTNNGLNYNLANLSSPSLVSLSKSSSLWDGQYTSTTLDANDASLTSTTDRSVGDQLLDRGEASLGYEKSTGLAIAIKADGTVEYAPGRPCRGDVLAENSNASFTQINGQWFVIDPEDSTTCWATNKTPTVSSKINGFINGVGETLVDTAKGAVTFVAILPYLSSSEGHQVFFEMHPTLSKDFNNNLQNSYTNFSNDIQGNNGSYAQYTAYGKVATQGAIILAPLTKVGAAGEAVGEIGNVGRLGETVGNVGSKIGEVGEVAGGTSGEVSSVVTQTAGAVVTDTTSVTSGTATTVTKVTSTDAIETTGTAVTDSASATNNTATATTTTTTEVTQGSSKAASIEDILKGATESTNGKGIARNFDKSGGFEQTLKDFESLDLDPATVKDIQTQYGPGKVGKLRDGTTVVARPGSNTGGPTLEITVSNSKVYKVRY